ncbi:hypothetical protein ACFQ1S_02040 [Kibdelosporangium lantanae]|uniref:DUF7168 domain-containing protein n=1 Tax=Kibdelosporangium lantanae TaxID=1497396 RepID=A0ABW3M660_9PSEU
MTHNWTDPRPSTLDTAGDELDPQKKDQVLAKARDLFWKASLIDNDPNGQPGEAEAMRATAMKMLTKYRIDVALAQDGKLTTAEVTTREVQIKAPYADVLANLCGTVFEHFGCEVVLRANNRVKRRKRDERGRPIKDEHKRPEYEWVSSYGKGGRVVAYGFAEDLELAELLYTSLLMQALTEMVKHQPPYLPDKGRYEDTGTYRSSWLRAFMYAITDRLRQIRKDQRSDEPASVSTGTDLVLVDRHQLVQQVFQQAHPNLKPIKLPTSGSGEAEGYEAGRRADLGIRPRVDKPNRPQLPA